MISAAARELSERLKGISDEHAFEARQIIKEYAGDKPTYEEISPSAWDKCLEAVRRRETGEPLQYIFGRWEFYGLSFSVGEGVLIPRADTETVTERVIDHLKRHGGKFIDLCAGSGCIGIAAAHYSGCEGCLIEKSETAARYAEENIRNNGLSDRVRLITGDILDTKTAALFEDESVSVIVSNPPYLDKRDMAMLQREVSFEPPSALYGGEDGLDFYRGIFPLWKSKLSRGGMFAVEIGDTQAKSVEALMTAAGFSPKLYKDMNGRDRALIAIKE